MEGPILFRKTRQFLIVCVSKCLTLVPFSERKKKQLQLINQIFAFEMICVSILSIARRVGQHSNFQDHYVPQFTLILKQAARLILRAKLNIIFVDVPIAVVSRDWKRLFD